MEDYTIRKATLADVSFLAEVIVGAEKSNSEKLGLATLFNLQEYEVRELLIAMLEEEIDGCEFSVSSFLITEYDGKPVAAVGGWVEGLAEDNMPSKVLKANLLSFTYPKESLKFLQTNAQIISGILIEREYLSLQIEYVYVDKDHRGKRLAEHLIWEHINLGKKLYPELNKVQVQVFKNNKGAVKLYERIGFKTAKIYKSDYNQILDFLPFDEKFLMERL